MSRKKRSRASGDDTIPPEVLETILRTVIHQIDTMNPPEVRQTYNRLRALGLTEREIMEQMMFAYMGESVRSVAEKDEFNLANYVLNLSRLPLPLHKEPEPTEGAPEDAVE